MGPSGCGKSTLLNLMGMLDSPSSGSYVFDGKEVAGLPESRLAEVRKASIGFIFQSFNLVDELTVRENVELALLYHDVSASERRHRSRPAARPERGYRACNSHRSPRSGRAAGRSEEHTSELQSLMRISYAVFCLKKTKINTHS